MTSPAANNRPLTVSLVLTALGLALSIYLAVVHVHAKIGAGGSSLCNVNTYLSCDAAASSRYSELGGVPIVLRELRELTYAEIAEVMGIPVDTVKTRIFRARAPPTRR